MDGRRGARTQRQRLKLLDASVGAALPDVSVGLGLIARDLARALGAEVALLAVPNESLGNVEVLAAWGGPPSHDGLPSSLAAEGFVSRALEFERAAVEPIDPHADEFAALASEAELTRVVGAPVRPLIGPSAVLCAAFAGEPAHDLPTTLWLAESYARLASLCLHDPEALDGLLSGGRMDGLTGCLTQVAFLQELRRELARSHRHGRPLSCSFIDLDHFKRVNDRYGHLHGSRVLASIAAVLRAGIRNEDTLGRYGGDEFVVLLPDTHEAAALELSNRLRSRIAKTMINLPHDPIDASIGVAEWRPGSSLEALLGAADEALLAAKASGGATAIGAGALTLPTAPENDLHRLSARPARPIAVPSDGASVKDVLDVTALFDESGGASIELAAWELDVALGRVVSAWSRAIKQGFLEPAGTDEASGEEMWRLSEDGRRARGSVT
jgi:diguanylate cyclase (GGDEF)-like protein